MRSQKDDNLFLSKIKWISIGEKGLVTFSYEAIYYKRTYDHGSTLSYDRVG